MWRDDIETFAAYLLTTDEHGHLDSEWVGTHSAQYPTVDSLAQALDASGNGLDPTSHDLAHSYQLQIWDRIGPCALTGTRHNDGRHHLTIVTPNGQQRPLRPTAERDDRSTAFGPPAQLAWGATGAGALETARCILEYTGSTTRTPNELFNDARALTIASIQHWPPHVTINVADIHQWASTRNPIPHLTATSRATTIDQLAAARPTSRPPRQRPPAAEQPADTHRPRHRDRSVAPALA
jgi:hypothetical protein